jgi:hypothetical protein
LTGHSSRNIRGRKFWVLSIKFWVLWEPTTTLSNQRRPQRHQCPLGWVLLGQQNKMWTSEALVRPSELLLPWDSSFVVHTATMSLLAATLSADSPSGHLDSLGSPPPVLTALWLARSQPAADARTTNVPSASQPAAAGIHQAHPALQLWPFTSPVIAHSACLPAHLYTLLLTAINICFRNLHGCSSMLPEQTSHSTIVI